MLRCTVLCLLPRWLIPDPVSFVSVQWKRLLLSALSTERNAGRCYSWWNVGFGRRFVSALLLVGLAVVLAILVPQV